MPLPLFPVVADDDDWLAELDWVDALDESVAAVDDWSALDEVPAALAVALELEADAPAWEAAAT